MTPVQIRRNILIVLNEFYKEKPHGMMGTSDILLRTGVDCVRSAAEFQGHLRYLLEGDYIRAEQSKVLGVREPAYGHITDAAITYKGIDLIEDPSEFNKKFPDVQIQINVTIENLFANIKQAIEEAPNISEEDKKNTIDQIYEFLNNPFISPFLGAGLLKLLGGG